MRRRGALRGFTTDIVKSHAANLVAEDLQIKNMTRLATDTIEAVGRTAAQEPG